ncbi:ROK family protein [Frigoribacterium sp. PhB24]|uniref:ROK family protein n=1 Tax=Frigoribacterium sp. PhB24 TaxID=2485204 RepID=UPI000F479DAA|nr:ROK family protein [Frigoribacterium sp. PhB24]ROS48094.1 putative NBD/HSP70 family sugar kinase [Frigoribacterium sp. PhB24]
MALSTGVSSPSLLRRMNAAEVLRHAWSVDAVTASDLIALTGLTRSTVIGVCDDLIDHGWMVSLADARSTGEYRKGRPARRYALARSAGHVVGVDAGRHHLTAVVADLRGDVVARVARRIDPDGTAAARRRTVARLVDDVLAEAGLADPDVLAIALGVPAPTDAEGRSPVEVGADFWVLMNPDYTGLFAERGWAVVVENDANLAAVAEAAAASHADREAGAGATSFVTLLAGERFGAGFVLDGALVRGSRGAAGEMRLLDLVEGVGSADGLGALLRDWARAARQLGTVPAASPLRAIPLDELEAPAVLAAADAGDATALRLVERAAERFGRVCAMLSGMLDVDRIVVAGAVAPAIGLLLERTTPWLSRFTHRAAPEVVASTLGDAVVTTGAVERALAHVRGHALELTLPGAADATRAS